MTDSLVNGTATVFFEESSLNSNLFQTGFFAFKICLLIATIVLNTIVLIIVVRLRNKKHGFSNYLFFSSTIADLLVGLTAEPFMITYNSFYKTSTGKNSCFYWLIINNSCLFLNISLINLLLITIHRYNQLKSALVHDRLTYWRNFLIFSVWIFSCVFWSSMIIPIINISRSSSIFECTLMYSAYYVVLIEVITLITPIILICVVNLLTYFKLKEKALKMKQTRHIRKIDSTFKVFNNRVLSNSDNCLPEQDKQKNQNPNLLSPSSIIKNETEVFTASNRSFNLKYSSNNSSIKNFAASIRKNSNREYIRTSLVPKRPAHFDYFRRKLTKERKAFLCLFSISVGLISSWLLFLIMWPLRIICNTCVSEILFSISVWSNYSSAAANPLILLIFHSKFQTELISMISNLNTFFKRPIRLAVS